jgi:hypothetical protein
VIFIEAGAAVDIARAVGFVREEIVLRNALEKARMMATSPMSTVSVFVVVEYDVSVVVAVDRCSPVMSDITKEEFEALKVSRQLYSHQQM